MSAGVFQDKRRASVPPFSSVLNELGGSGGSY